MGVCVRVLMLLRNLFVFGVALLLCDRGALLLVDGGAGLLGHGLALLLGHRRALLHQKGNVQWCVQ